MTILTTTHPPLMTTVPAQMTEAEDPFDLDLVVTLTAAEVVDRVVEVAEVVEVAAAEVAVVAEVMLVVVAEVMLAVAAVVVLKVAVVVAAVALTLICVLVEVAAWAAVVQVHLQVHPVLLVLAAQPNEQRS